MGDLRSWMEQWAEMEAKGESGGQTGVQSEDTRVPDDHDTSPSPRRLHLKAPENPVPMPEMEQTNPKSEPVANTEPRTVESVLVTKSERQEKLVERAAEVPSKEVTKDEPDVEGLFRRSGTEEKFRERWYAIMEKARHSKSSTFVTRKVLAGRFRVTESEMEILPDMDVYGMSSKGILTSQWNV